MPVSRPYCPVRYIQIAVAQNSPTDTIYAPISHFLPTCEADTPRVSLKAKPAMTHSLIQSALEYRFAVHSSEAAANAINAP
ncbi:MAG: hypothetical protein NVSMB39_6920 [Candidatus Saccharimonadales bacterium]